MIFSAFCCIFQTGIYLKSHYHRIWTSQSIKHIFNVLTGAKISFPALFVLFCSKEEMTVANSFLSLLFFIVKNILVWNSILQFVKLLRHLAASADTQFHGPAILSMHCACPCSDGLYLQVGARKMKQANKMQKNKPRFIQSLK